MWRRHHAAATFLDHSLYACHVNRLSFRGRGCDGDDPIEDEIGGIFPVTGLAISKGGATKSGGTHTDRSNVLKGPAVHGPLFAASVRMQREESIGLNNCRITPIGHWTSLLANDLR